MGAKILDNISSVHIKRNKRDKSDQDEITLYADEHSKLIEDLKKAIQAGPTAPEGAYIPTYPGMPEMDILIQNGDSHQELHVLGPLIDSTSQDELFLADNNILEILESMFSAQCK